MSVSTIAAAMLLTGMLGDQGVGPALSSDMAGIAVAASPAVEPAAPTAIGTTVSQTPPVTAPAQATVQAGAQAGPAAPADHADHNDIVVTARHDSPGDPLVQVNAKSFAVTQKVDMALVGPAAIAYERTIPAPVRSGVRNFLYNVREPTVFLNFLLQLKPGKAMETLGRFTVNSTIGIGGLFDVAKRRPFKLPRRANGFADTFGYYGVKPGLFLFVPVIGPTTLRDLVGGTLDRLVLPLAVGTPFNKLAYSIPTGVLSALNHRVEFDEQLHKMRDENPDAYTAFRDYYLEQRQAEIDGLHGRRRNPVEAPGKPAPAPVIAPAPAGAEQR